MSEFVSFEISKKLKEKGFPQLKKNTLAMYNEVGEWFSLARYLDEDEYCFDDFDEHDCVAPTISQVLKWLRERDIMVEIIPSLVDDGTWTFSFRIQTKKFYDRSTKDYTSYESAALSCIEYVLDWI